MTSTYVVLENAPYTEHSRERHSGERRCRSTRSILSCRSTRRLSKHTRWRWRTSIAALRVSGLRPFRDHHQLRESSHVRINTSGQFHRRMFRRGAGVSCGAGRGVEEGGKCWSGTPCAATTTGGVVEAHGAFSSMTYAGFDRVVAGPGRVMAGPGRVMADPGRVMAGRVVASTITRSSRRGVEGEWRQRSLEVVR